LVGVRHTTLPDEPSGNGRATYRPSLWSSGVSSPPLDCPGLRHRPAPRGRAWRAAADCARGGLAIPVAPVPLRSVLRAVWGVQSASKISLDLRRRSGSFSSLISGTGD